MNTLIFSQAAVFHLNQLSNLMMQHTGKRYRLSSTEGIVMMLMAASKSSKTDIQALYQHLLAGLSKEQKLALTNISRTLNDNGRSQMQTS